MHNPRWFIALGVALLLTALCGCYLDNPLLADGWWPDYPDMAFCGLACIAIGLLELRREEE